jgi:serine/threonine protein kinase
MEMGFSSDMIRLQVKCIRLADSTNMQAGAKAKWSHKANDPAQGNICCKIQPVVYNTVRAHEGVNMIGQTISHYKILEKIGEGGTSVGYKAEDTSLKRHVVLKFPSAQILADQVKKTRFIHEVRAAAALDHPNICTLYEIGETEEQTFKKGNGNENRQIFGRFGDPPTPTCFTVDPGCCNRHAVV